MLSPEVVNFPLGKTSRKWARVGRIADGDSGSPWASAAKCAAATVVKDLRVFLPEALHPPEALLSELLQDKEFYRMGPVVNIGVLAACLVDREFVATFVKNGQFCLSARSTEWTLSVNPSGTLTLEGPLTTSTMTCRRGPAFQTDLKSCLEKGTLNSARRALTNLLTTLCEGVEFTVVEFMWRPEEPSVCPSTIAKYFHSSLDGFASVEEVRPELTLLRREPPLGLIPIISFGEDDDDDVGTCPFGVADHENVLGAIQLGLDESSVSRLWSGAAGSGVACKKVLLVMARGLYLGQDLRGIVDGVVGYLDSLPDGENGRQLYASVTASPVLTRQQFSRNRKRGPRRAGASGYCPESSRRTTVIMRDKIYSTQTTLNF